MDFKEFVIAYIKLIENKMFDEVKKRLFPIGSYWKTARFIYELTE